MKTISFSKKVFCAIVFSCACAGSTLCVNEWSILGLVGSGTIFAKGVYDLYKKQEFSCVVPVLLGGGSAVYFSKDLINGQKVDDGLKSTATKKEEIIKPVKKIIEKNLQQEIYKKDPFVNISKKEKFFSRWRSLRERLKPRV